MGGTQAADAEIHGGSSVLSLAGNGAPCFHAAMAGDGFDGPHTVRVRYGETDRMGVAHHGSYVAWFEEARTEWLRRRGRTYRQLEDDGLLLQVVEMSVRYLKPVDYDDELLIWLRVQECGKAALALEYRVEHSGHTVATGRTRLCCVGRDGRLRRLPPEIAEPRVRTDREREDRR